MKIEGSEPAPMPALDLILERIAQINGRANTVLDMLTVIGDRSFGKPETGEGTSTEAVPDGLVDRAMVELSRLDGTIARLDAAAQRLQGLA